MDLLGDRFSAVVFLEVNIPWSEFRGIQFWCR